MKILVSLGPIIGAVIIIVYVAVIRVYLMLHGTRKFEGTPKLIYKILLGVEIAVVAASFLIPAITGESYLIRGMSRGSKFVITDETFRVSYKEANRAFENSIELTEEELEKVKVKCSAESGTVALTITQGEVAKEVDITNSDMQLDMTGFEPGRIRFTMEGDNASNVAFELFW